MTPRKDVDFLKPMEDKYINFIKKPQYGDVCKVYKSQRSTVSFGIVMGIEIDIDWDYQQRYKMFREIALLKPLNQEFELSQCCFCIPDTKVRFISHEEENILKLKNSDTKEI
jgi:hypothetical protein